MKLIASKLRNGWQLLPHMQSDGHRIVFQFAWFEERPATEAQRKRAEKKNNYWKDFENHKPPQMGMEIEEIDSMYELLAIDPGRDQVLAWVRNNFPRFYSQSQYRNDFGLDQYNKRMVIERQKQQRRWKMEKRPNYFDLHCKTSLKQYEEKAMKENIDKLRKIAQPLFQFYQRGIFNRLRFDMYRRRKAGMEKIVKLIREEKKTNKSQKLSDQARQEVLKKREEKNKKWRKVQKIVTVEKRRREEQRKRERAAREKEMEAQGKSKKKKKKKEEQPDLLPQKRRNRVATARRREKRQMNKSFDFRRPSLNVMSNAFPNPADVSLKEFLVAEQIVRLQKRTETHDWKEIMALQDRYSKEQAKKKPNKNIEKELHLKLKAFLGVVESSLQTDNSSRWFVKEKQLVDQWKRIQKGVTVKEE